MNVLQFQMADTTKFDPSIGLEDKLAALRFTWTQFDCG